MRGGHAVIRLLPVTAVKRLYPLVALAAITFAVAGAMAGPGASMNVSVSEYAVADRGGVTELAMAVMALRSVALLGGLRAEVTLLAVLAGWLVWLGNVRHAANSPAYHRIIASRS